MRYVLLALLLLPAFAGAQPKCWPSQVGGTGTAAVVRTNSAGMVFGWGCTDGFSSWRVVNWGNWSDYAANWQERGALLAASTDAERSAAWTQLSTVGKPPSTEVYSAVQDVWSAIVLPPVPSRVVARNSTFTTRPAYALVDGVRGTSIVDRATVGVPCDCSVRSVSSTSVYCAYSAEKTKVALCTVAP